MLKEVLKVIAAGVLVFATLALAAINEYHQICGRYVMVSGKR